MTFAEIRSRLAGLEGRAYWRSLEELSDTPEFRDYLHREFPSQASEFTDPAGRRQFLKLMGASIALAGVSACTRQPQELIVPYRTQPEDMVPGRPLFFATAMPLGGYAHPVLAENHMGRPTKVEGNPEHPASLGAADLLTQASVLGLYDPDRSRTIMNRGEVGTWTDFTTALTGRMGLPGLRILSEPITSPSVLEQLEQLQMMYPGARWHQWDPVYGTTQGGAREAMPLCRFDQADVIVSLDDDFLGFGPGAVRYARDFSSRRRVDTPEAELNRLYVVEPTPTVTGSKADHRLALKARDVDTFARGLAAALGVGTASTGELPEDARTRWIPALADDLRAHAGRSLVTVGARQPAAVHALARAMNEVLGNVGSTVTYAQPIAGGPADGAASISELVADMNAGAVEMLLILDSNPVFTAPADLGFAEALDNVGLRVHVGLYHDETAERCHWHVPAAHYLESWGDARAFDGTVSLIQPLIQPLYDGHTALEVLAAMNGNIGLPPRDLVVDYWNRAIFSMTSTAWALRDASGQPYTDFDRFWQQTLHDGFVPHTSLIGASGAPMPTLADVSGAQPALEAGTPAGAPAAASGMEVLFVPDAHLLDGRFANNAWLQELPRPLTKITWDAVALIGVQTAERLGLEATRVGNDERELLEVTYEGRALRLPVWVLPGAAEDVVAVTFGFGRTQAGRVGSNVGMNGFGIRTSAAPWFGAGAEVARTGEYYAIASTQNHFQMEGRHMVRAVNLEDYREDPHVVAEMGHVPDPELTLYPEHEYTGYKWGMAIDLNACTGCGACVAACVAENNIPVVGKEQVMRSREMHWLRVDTYYEGDLAEPEATHHQPVPCMQCENAPCEVVCPVAATVHSDEGLNDMVYNRCVGTRYCSNNCPYKVRRFNFMLYSDFSTPELRGVRNPDVTIRSRGVMEKCTYCVQRINLARIDAKTGQREIADGEIKTACQQTCPAEAIVFGDLNDPNSQVSRVKQQERNYGLLEELGTRPRTTYLAVVRNPNPALS